MGNQHRVDLLGDGRAGKEGIAGGAGRRRRRARRQMSGLHNSAQPPCRGRCGNKRRLSRRLGAAQAMIKVGDNGNRPTRDVKGIEQMQQRQQITAAGNSDQQTGSWLTNSFGN